MKRLWIEIKELIEECKVWVNTISPYTPEVGEYCLISGVVEGAEERVTHCERKVLWKNREFILFDDPGFKPFLVRIGPQCELFPIKL